MKRWIAVLLALVLTAAGQAGARPEPDFDPDAMEVPVRALVMAMTENDLAYDPGSAEFVWTALWYALNVCAPADERAEYTQDALIVPEECVWDLCHALFSGRTDLPPIPAALADRVVYDRARLEYRLAPGDPSLAEVELGVPEARSDGTLALCGRLFDPEDGSTECTFQLTLTKIRSMFNACVHSADVQIAY